MTIEARFRLTRGDFTLDASLTIPSCGVTAVFGPSGCGKTTLLRAVAGLERDPGGRLSVSGDTWHDSACFVPTHRRAVGFVFQEASLFSHLTVRGNLAYGFKRVPPGERRVSFSEAVELLGVQPLLNRNPAELSGGERQRVAIARALLASPRLLLLDEPLTGLDAASKTEILPFLERLHEELRIPVIYVSHHFDEIARLADYLVLMDAGRVVAAGPLAELLRRLDLPLAHAPDAESIVETTVAGHDEVYGLTTLGFPAGRFTVPRVDLPVGRGVRVRVLARDVSLTLQRQSGTSILNIFPATIREMSAGFEAQTTIVLDMGQGVSMLARVTRKSAAALNLAPGSRVFAQVKSVALLGPAATSAVRRVTPDTADPNPSRGGGGREAGAGPR
jgi:molybdate transport system ATP-binding protein